MVSIFDLQRLDHESTQFQYTDGTTNEAINPISLNKRHGTTRTFRAPPRSGTASNRTTLLSPESSLRSRLPWLDGKPPSRTTSTVLSPLTKPNAQLPISSSSSLSSSQEFPRLHLILPVRKEPSKSAEPAFKPVSLHPIATGPEDESRRLTPVNPRESYSNTSSSSSQFPRRPLTTPPRKESARFVDHAQTSTSLRRVGKLSEVKSRRSTSIKPRKDCSRRKNSTHKIQLPMKPSIDQHPNELSLKREKTVIDPPIPRKLSLIDSLHPTRRPPSPLSLPMLSPMSPKLSYPVIDSPLEDPVTSPLNRAITRMEDLMRQAEHLVNEAADNGRPEETGEAIEDSRTVLRRASQAGNIRHPSQRSPPYRRSRLFSSSHVSSSYSGSSSVPTAESVARVIAKDGPTRPSDLHVPSTERGKRPKSDEVLVVGDDSDTSPGRGRRRRRSSSAAQAPKIQELAIASPVTRDFAYGQPKIERANQSAAEEHWIGRRPSRNLSGFVDIPLVYPLHHHEQQSHQEHHVHHEYKPHTAYISDSPSSHSSTLRHRKTNLPQESPPKAKALRRHNTAANYGQEGYLPQGRETSPIPWEKKLHPRKGPHNLHSHRSLERQHNQESHDTEKHAGESKHRHRFGGWHLGHEKREPIARKWGTFRKRFSASVACINTALVGYILGVYGGMVPRIQFQLADQKHYILLGNIYMYVGLAVTTFFAWPLPLLHGRKPYILAALALALPLQLPQAILVDSQRKPSVLGHDLELLLCRLLNGFVLGLTNINDFAVLLDCFGASLMSDQPHQEIVVYDDPRRDGGGLGLWLGIWCWCFVGSIAVGFMSGAGIIFKLNPAWGFYVTVILVAFVLVLNIIAPETRRSAYRHHWREWLDDEDKVRRKIARGEIKLHISDEGPKYWFDELWAGVVLSKRMFLQRGFMILSLYVGWMYGQNVLVIVLLGALLSRHYRLKSEYVGFGVAAIALGALLAIPLTKANIFSRARKQGPRTDSMTFERQISWSSHLTRRLAFMIMLPISGIIYTVVSPGLGIHISVPIVFAGLMGFFGNLAIAECYGLIMETWDTSDLQPGVNSKHRSQSMAETVRRRRTTYSCFPRVMAGVFISQSLGFLFAAAATGIGGILTRSLGAQVSTGVAAAILFFLTILLTGALWRFKNIQVIPNHAFGTRIGTGEWDPSQTDEYWKPVVVGNPSGKIRRMSLLELGSLSRWTEIRRLNKLV